MFEVLFSTSDWAAENATLKLECGLHRDVFSLQETCLLKHGYSEKSMSIDVQFFSDLRVFQEKVSLPLKMRYARLSILLLHTKLWIKVSLSSVYLLCVNSEILITGLFHRSADCKGDF